jgi:hypothetical protein
MDMNLLALPSYKKTNVIHMKEMQGGKNWILLKEINANWFF